MSALYGMLDGGSETKSVLLMYHPACIEASWPSIDRVSLGEGRWSDDLNELYVSSSWEV